jgi:hypothetical protein
VLGFTAEAMYGQAARGSPGEDGAGASRYDDRGSKHTTGNNWLNGKGAAKDLSTTIYDDTGRSLQTMKVRRLLDQTQHVIDRRDKEAREMEKKAEQALNKKKGSKGESKASKQAIQKEGAPYRNKLLEMQGVHYIPEEEDS